MFDIPHIQKAHKGRNMSSCGDGGIGVINEEVIYKDGGVRVLFTKNEFCSIPKARNAHVWYDPKRYEKSLPSMFHFFGSYGTLYCDYDVGSAKRDL